MTRMAAVITDLHGNLPALEAALARIDELGAGDVYCGGDLIGYGPHPNEVCAQIADSAIPTIYGNYDYAIGCDLEDCGCTYVDEHDRATRAAAFAVLRERDGDIDVEIERVTYDALAVAREMRAAGLPAELADKLVAAA